MGASVTFMTEARLGGRWENIDFRYPTKNGEATIVPLLDAGSVGAIICHDVFPRNLISFSDLSEVSKSTLVTGYPLDPDSYADIDRDYQFQQVPSTWFKGRHLYRPQWCGLIEKNALADVDVDPQEAVDLYSISPTDYAALPIDAQRAYMYHEFDDLDGTYTALRKLYGGMIARIDAFNDYVYGYYDGTQWVRHWLNDDEVRIVAAMGW